MLKKKCIFCGNKAIEKNKEHVIPNWLIEYTGQKNREIHIAYPHIDKKIKKLNIPFSSFAFPSCKSCNTNFSKLEALTKDIIIGILEEKELSADDFDTLLCWFDKVRVGLWIGALIISKNLLDITPRFYINNRINTSDRLLFIYKIDGIKTPHLSFYGTNSLVFYSAPSVFGMIINNYAFINASDSFLFSKSFGLPYPTKFKFKNKNKFPIAFSVGSQNKQNKIFPIKYFDVCTEIYQPIISNSIKKLFNDSDTEKYINSFYQKNTYSNSKIFIKKDDKIQEYPENKSDIWIPNTAVRMKNVNDISEAIFKFQNHLMQNQIEHKTYFKNGEKSKYVNYLNFLIKTNKILMKNKVVVQDSKNPNRYCSKALLDL